jgi:hypothetical protein
LRPLRVGTDPDEAAWAGTLRTQDNWAARAKRAIAEVKELLDPALRLDHCYGIYMRPGSGGLNLHGGGTPYDRPEYFHFRNGQMYNGLTVVSWALTDVPPGQGGFACIPGSHKANYPCPRPIRTFESNPGCVVQVPMRAGDVLIFTEALTHGTQRWTAPFQRRSLLYKYAPGHLAWGSGYASHGRWHRARAASTGRPISQ